MSLTEQKTERYVSYISFASFPKSCHFEDIKLATQNDPTLQAIIHAIISGNWHNQKNSPVVDGVGEITCQMSTNTTAREPFKMSLLKLWTLYIN